MTSGPIEFLSDGPDQPLPASEYGGVAGLIQPQPHAMTASEANAAITRAARYGDDLNNDVIIDPATGRVVDPGLISGA